MERLGRTIQPHRPTTGKREPPRPGLTEQPGPLREQQWLQPTQEPARKSTQQRPSLLASSSFRIRGRAGPSGTAPTGAPSNPKPRRAPAPAQTGPEERASGCGRERLPAAGRPSFRLVSVWSRACARRSEEGAGRSGAGAARSCESRVAGVRRAAGPGEAAEHGPRAERDSSAGGIHDNKREQNYVKNSGGTRGENELRPSSQLHSPLEKTKTGFMSEKIFETVSLSSDSLFQRAVSILHTSYLDSSSEHGFHYSQVTLVKNDIFLNEYKAFYQVKKARNYTEEELRETYGFLLFETENQAKLVCHRGLCVGSSANTTLGDPAKGVYVSKYSDYLHARPWYHGKSGYIVIFNLIKGRVKLVSENYTTNYTNPSIGYDCHVATNTNKVSHKRSHFRTFELSQYYLYEFSGSSAVTERPRQICPYLIVAFQYREPRRMAAPTSTSSREVCENVLTSSWTGKLIIQGCLLCDITLRSSCGAMIPIKLPHELDFKYVMKVSSLKRILPQAAFKNQNKNQNNLEQKQAFSQEMCFNMYEVELSNNEEKITKLTEYIKKKQLAIIKCLEDRGVFILLTSSALISESNRGDEQMSLCGLHVFHSSLPTGMKDLKVKDDISLKVTPVLPALTRALLEAKKSYTEEGICPNSLVKHSLQELCKVDKSPSLAAAPQDVENELVTLGSVPGSLDLTPIAKKCPSHSLTHLRSYLSNPNGYVLEVSAALDLLAGHPLSPCISDGICDAGLSLATTPDSELLESEVGGQKPAKKNSEEASQRTKVPLGLASTVRVQPKRKASTPSTVQSKKVNTCRPLPKRGAVIASKVSDLETTVKLVKGPCPLKRKRGAEVLAAQVVPTTRRNPKDQEAPIPKDVPVATNSKRARKQGKLTVTAVLKNKLPLQKSSKNQRISPVKGNQTPRFKTPPQPAKEESTSRIQSEISSAASANASNTEANEESTSRIRPEISSAASANASNTEANEESTSQIQSEISSAASASASNTEANEESSSQIQSEISSAASANASNTDTGEPEKVLGTPKDHPENPGVSCDSQALNMLADLALSSSTSASSSSDTRDLSCSSQLPQKDLLNSKEHSLRGTSDHEYHRGARHPRGGTLAIPAANKKGLSTSDPVSNRAPVEAQPTPEERLETSQSQKSVVAMEHSYALIVTEHSKKQLQQRGVPGPAFAKNSTKGPDAGTPVGKVMPFWHQQITSPLQKLPDHPLLKQNAGLLPSSLREFCCSRTVFPCEGSFKVTVKCETEYVFSLDSKYTNNPLEKTVLRALHGPWNADLPDNVEEVKLLLHMWVALFYSGHNKVLRASRRVVEHSNPAKYVSLNSTLDSLELSENEDPINVDILLENSVTPEAQTTASFPDTNTVPPLLKPPSARGLELWIQNDQKEVCAREEQPVLPERQPFIYSCSHEIIEEKEKQESSDKLDGSDSMLSRNSQTSLPFVLAEDKTFESLDSRRVRTYNDSITQTTVTMAYDGLSTQSAVCKRSPRSPLESQVGIFQTTVQADTEALQGLLQQNSPFKDDQSSPEKKDGSAEYVVINLEPVTLTFEKNLFVPIQTEIINGTNTPATFNMELIKQLSPPSIMHTVSSEKTPAPSILDIQSLTVPGQLDTKFLCASPVSRESLAEETCSSGNKPVRGSSSPPACSVLMEATLAQTSKYGVPREEIKLSEKLVLQAPSIFSMSSEEISKPSKVAVSLSASATSRKSDSFTHISSGVALEDHNCGHNSENVNFRSFNSAFTKHYALSLSKEVSLELSGEDSDIDLTLTLSPPTSPSEVPAGDITPNQEVVLTSVNDQRVAENNTGPGENEVMNSSHPSVYPVETVKPPANKGQRGEHGQPVTVTLPQANYMLNVSEEVHVPSDFPFGSLIEEVSPASSPGPQASAEEMQPQASIKSPYTGSKRKDKSSQIEAGDLTIKEENASVGPAFSVDQGNLTQGLETQLPAERSLLLNDSPDGKETHFTLPGNAPKETGSEDHDESSGFSEQIPCYDSQVKHSDSATNYSSDLKPLEKSDTLQPVCMKNRNSDLNHLVSETSKLPSSPQGHLESMTSVDTLEPLEKSDTLQPVCMENRNSDLNLVSEISKVPSSPQEHLESKTSDDTFVPTAAPNNGTSMPSKEQMKQILFGNLKSSEGNYMQVRSFEVESGDRVDNTEANVQAISLQLTASSGDAPSTCPLPVSAETGLQSQIVPLVRMATLLRNETETLLPDATSLDSFVSQTHPSDPNGGELPGHMLSDMSASETENPMSGGLVPTYTGSYPDTVTSGEMGRNEPSASYVSKSGDLICGISGKQTGSKGPDDQPRTLDRTRIQNRDLDWDVGVNSDIQSKPFSGDYDDFVDAGRKSKFDLKACTPRYRHSKKKGEDSSFLHTGPSDHEDWSISKQILGLETNMPSKNRGLGLKKDKCRPSCIQIQDLHGIPRTYANFTITKGLPDASRPLHSPQPIQHDLLSPLVNTGQEASDLTQNTLDLEYLCFAHKLRQTVKRTDPLQSTPSISVLKAASPSGAFPVTETAACPVRPTCRSQSPLMVTIMSPEPRKSMHTKGHQSASGLDISPSWKERNSLSRKPANPERKNVSFHLHKLKYNSPLKDPRNDISLILNEYAEFNKVMNSNQVIFQDHESNAAECALSEDLGSSFPRRCSSYEDMITDLCASLHIRLKSVMKEACQSTFLFYIVETEDQAFLLRTKNILRKGGHTEIEPQHFCQAFHRENDTLIVIIRNEDIASHLHQIPSLLKLKHFPNVLFAGIDSPEDVLDYTYQELFPTGGFVVSDDEVLEMLTLVQLKEVVKILEKLNGNGRWKWLLHYREHKKLKEDVRIDSTAHKKYMILQSCRSTNIIELLHYHQCDSRPSAKGDYLKCLRSLQVQHICSRFAIFLTEKPAVSREVFENNGILVTDVNNFIENIQKVAAPFRSSYW